ncbi:YihY/virulence factor BrkB family protein [Armatimonas sp.]|uniref:YihY/virulence factor BrkB family protein n=1 Tax=Armatimonas sp. TaxID=1872638 RepID=UPI00286C8CC4|nr:YihY/virulence factor BrkB family protein [Armatimonas sp.]
MHAFEIFTRIDGIQAAAAFANYAFFSLFPLIVLFVTIASFFINPAQAEISVLNYVKGYVPITGALQSALFDTITGVVNARGQASVVATLFLIWSAQQFFNTLILTANRAWSAEAYNWWQLPLKSLMFLGVTVCAVLLGVAVPVLSRIGTWILPLLIVFLSVSFFYQFSPSRKITFSEIWLAALVATVAFQIQNSIFMLYINNIAKLNVIYGAFGAVMALLLWIYFSGNILFFGACLCAAQAEEKPGA